MKDYQREELKVQAERAKQHLKSDCPLLEDEVAVAAWEYIQELEEKVKSLEKHLSDYGRVSDDNN